MSFEEVKFQEAQRLYPERPSLEAEKRLQEVKELEEGKGVIELNGEEMENVLDYEKEFQKELERIFTIQIISPIVYPEYFLTKEGRDDFRETMGVDIVGESIIDIEKFLLNNRVIFKNIDSRKRSELFGRAEKFSDDQLAEEIESNMDNQGNFNLLDLKIPSRFKILLNPKEALEKISGLRKLKDKIKRELQGNINGDDETSLAKRAVLDIYKRKINQMIVDQFSSSRTVFEMSHKIDTGLSEDEEILLRMFSGFSDLEKTASRFDKFIFGTDGKSDEEGNRRQVAEKLKKIADKIEEVYLENEISKRECIENGGLKYDEVMDEKISVADFASWANELLEHYGEKSDYAMETYKPDRKGPAPDNKWQFVARPEIKSMAVNSKQKVIKSPDRNKSFYDTVTVLLGHEIEGHFVQNLNKAKINLGIFGKIGGDRSDIFSEMGAMMMQDKISEKSFGIRAFPNSNYIKAMLKKIDGGNYLECMREFYESERKNLEIKRKNKVISHNEYQKELRKKLELAINRTKRLFRGGDLNSDSKELVSSKDTVYLEQFLLAEKMKEAGLEKYAFLGGINLDILKTLLKFKFLDSKNIKEPDFYASEIFNREKEKYRIRRSLEQ